MKKIETILRFIERTAMNNAQFEGQAGLSNAYIKNTVDRGSDITEKILGKFRQKNPELYFKVFPDEHPEKQLNGEALKQDQLLWLTASITAISNEVAKLQVKVFDRDLIDCVQELDYNTKLIIEQLRKKGL